MECLDGGMQACVCQCVCLLFVLLRVYSSLHCTSTHVTGVCTLMPLLMVERENGGAIDGQSVAAYDKVLQLGARKENASLMFSLSTAPVGAMGSFDFGSRAKVPAGRP